MKKKKVAITCINKCKVCDSYYLLSLLADIHAMVSILFVLLSTTWLIINLIRR